MSRRPQGTRPQGIPDRVWRGFPLAKQRLAVDGPVEEGSDAAFWAALAVASEARARGATQEQTLELVESMPLPRENRRTRAQAERGARFAYAKAQLLSGCCQDTRPRSGITASAQLRSSFENYCGEECARTCPMLLAIRNPSRSIAATPFEHAHDSSLWVHGGGLGQAGKLAYQLLALLAVAQGSDEFPAAQRYLCIKSNGAFDQRTFGKALTNLQSTKPFPLVTLLNKQTGRRRIHAPSPEEVAAIELERGVAGRRAANVAQARRESDAYQDWLAQELSGLGDPEAVEAWDPAPREGMKTESEGIGPRPILGWGGLTKKGG